MHIVHVASELAPVAKVGGLADVILGLSRELSWKGHDVDIIVPRYDCLNTKEVRDLVVEEEELLTFYEGEFHKCLIWTGWVENLKVYFIEPLHPRHFFHRGCFYGCDDDIERYLFFARAAIEYLYKKKTRPEIIHLHDWQAAAIAPLYYEVYSKLGWDQAKVVITLHNLEYQGKTLPEYLDKIGLDGKALLTPEKLQDEQDQRLINLLKGGIVYSDYVTTVSPTYAKEVLKEPGGRGLQNVLNQYIHKFQGIINGIDYSYWNPEIDRLLPSHFSERETPSHKNDQNTLDKKAFLKNYLREKLDLDAIYAPLVGCITRLVPQKGLELIKDALEYTIACGGQFILLGSSPIPEISKEFHQIRQKYEDGGQVRVILHTEEELAHLIYAAADIFIVPSLFEPCGLTQMIALKYGAIPVVRKTGGLEDTINDVDYPDKPLLETNGYVFEHPDRQGLISALERALQCWYQDPDRWRHLVIRGMKEDFSWKMPAEAYLKVYAMIKNS